MSTLREKLQQYNADLPLERASALPALWFTDPEILAAERKNVFRRTWQWVGREREVAENGQYFTAEVGPDPWVIARDAEGTLRSFSNICRHRGAKVAHEPCGRASFLQCRYHGWTYDLSGKLKGAPEFQRVENFFREENGLPAAKVSNWLGWLFVNATTPSTSLSENFFPVTDRLKSLGLEKFSFYERRRYELKCNWKLFVDNYLDGGYHVNTLHPELGAVIDYSQYRTEIARNTVLQLSPLKDATSSEFSVVREGQSAHYWWVYPNLMLNVYDNAMDLNVVRPLGPDRCEVIFEYFFPTGWEIDQKRWIEESLRASETIQAQDTEICEEVQRNLASPSFQPGRYSVSREAAVHLFHHLLFRDLNHLTE